MLKIWQALLISIVAIVFAAVWLATYQITTSLIWDNPFVVANHWLLPILVMFFSLIVGLAQKFLNAPNVISGGAMDAFKGISKKDDGKPSFLGALVTSFASMFSGASVGPEGALGELVRIISAFFRKKLKISPDQSLEFDSAAMASAYNGIVGNPLFTGVLATELNTTKKPLFSILTWNLMAGAIGFLFFTMLGLPVFAKYIPFTPITEISPSFILFAILLGVVGTVLATLTGLFFKFSQKFGDQIFKDNIILRVLSVGAIVAFVGFFVPEVLFAGETQIFPMLQNPAAYGFWLLVALAILKLFLLAISFKGGFLGGPTFPILFAATMLGLALSLLFPFIPVSIFVLCLEAATITLILNAPLTAILLVAIVGTADSYTICLLVVSSVTAMISGEALKKKFLRG